MTDTIYNSTNPLPAGDADALHVIPGSGTSFIDLTIYSSDTTKKAVKVTGTQQVVLAPNALVRGYLDAFDFTSTGTAAAPNSVHNAGFVSSAAGSAILFSGGGHANVVNTGSMVAATGIKINSAAATAASDRLDVFNAGSIFTTGIAVEGGYGDDRIVNNGILRTAGVDLIDLGAGNDFYDGTFGTAIGKIALGAGDDTAIGGQGSEIFSAGAGDDFIDGGAGIDTVDYSDAISNLTVDLRATARQTLGGGQGYDTLRNIENVTAGDHNDMLIGNDADNVLKGGAGKDTLEGGLGADILDGGDGSDDTVRYTGAAAVFVDLTATGPQYTGTNGYDTLIGIEHLEGGSGSDALTGNHLANRLTGNSGSDVLLGNDGNDTLEGGTGNDTMTGGKGDDSIDGGDGSNTVIFSGTRAEYTYTAPADRNTVFTITDNTANRDGIDQLKNVRFLKFSDQTIALFNAGPTSISLTKTSAAENTAIGTTVANLMGSDPEGDALTYTLVSNPGGIFSIDGTKLVLSKALNYEAATKYTIQVKAQDGYGGEIVKSLTFNVTNVVENVRVIRYGTSGRESISGENSHDKLYGLGGNDTLWGGNGNDTLYGGTGSDYLVGQAGRDAFVLDSRPNVRTNLDYLYDFKPADDVIYLPKAIFTKIAYKGALSSSAFVVGDRFKDTSDRILYHKTGGALFYDPDGSGKAAAVQIAIINKNLPITRGDFYVI